MPIVPLQCSVETNDRHYLQNAMKDAIRNRLDPGKLIKILYCNTFVSVANILERNGDHSKNMVKAVRTDIELELAAGDAKALTTTLTVPELLDTLCISTKWDDTYLLERIVCFLPEDEKLLAMNLVERYKVYLDVFDDTFKLKDCPKKFAATPETTEAQMSVELTVAKELSTFTRKDCKDMFELLLHKAWKIPLTKITVTEARSGNSTTVVFIIDKAFMQNIIQYSVKGKSVWAFKELSVTRVRISGLFELNVSQLLTQHFKEALRSGLTGNMDFVGATKVCGSCDQLLVCFFVFPLYSAI